MIYIFWIHCYLCPDDIIGKKSREHLELLWIVDATRIHRKQEAIRRLGLITGRGPENFHWLRGANIGTALRVAVTSQKAILD